MAVEQEQQDRNVRPRVSLGGDLLVRQLCMVQASALLSVRQEVVIPVRELKNFPARLRR